MHDLPSIPVLILLPFALRLINFSCIGLFFLGGVKGLAAIVGSNTNRGVTDRAITDRLVPFGLVHSVCADRRSIVYIVPKVLFLVPLDLYIVKKK